MVIGETGVLNNALRFEDEFARHKAWTRWATWPFSAIP